MTALVLLSGGMDSTVALFHTLNQKHGKVWAFTFFYGQRHHAEINHARDVVQIARRHYGNLAQYVELSLDNVMPRVGSLMADVPVTHYGTHKPLSGIDTSFIPHRNLLFTVIAAQWAKYIGANSIVLGVRGGFPDCTPGFMRTVQDTLQLSCPMDAHQDVRISSPVHESRARTVLMARSLSGCFDALAHTMTCFMGIEPPCGTCLPCIKRAEGFAEAGIPDPLILRLRPNA